MGIGDMLSKLFGGGSKDEEVRSGSEVAGTEAAGDVRPDDAAAAGGPREGGETVGTGAGGPPAGADASVEGGADRGHPELTKELVLSKLSEIYDPEIPVDIVNLGLIYDVEIEGSKVHVKMTLTSPGCPTAAQIAQECQYVIEEIPGVEEAWVEIVWDPPWDPSKMSEEARMSLGFG